MNEWMCVCVDLGMRRCWATALWDDKVTDESNGLFTLHLVLINRPDSRQCRQHFNRRQRTVDVILPRLHQLLTDELQCFIEQLHTAAFCTTSNNNVGHLMRVPKHARCWGMYNVLVQCAWSLVLTSWGLLINCQLNASSFVPVHCLHKLISNR